MVSLAVFYGLDLWSQTIISGTYNAATITGDIQINASTSATFTGGSTFTGANATLGANAGLSWQQVGTLSGKTLTQGSNSYLYVSGVNNAVTLDSATTVTGTARLYTDGSVGATITNQGTITNTTGTGQIYAANFTNSGSVTATAGTLFIGYPSAGYNVTNTGTGTITSNGSGTTVYLRGNVDNNGTVTAQNSGQLIYDGANTTANLGNVVLTGGGRALLNGTIDNTAATLTAPTGGTFELYGGTISGGTIGAGALSFTPNSGYLDGATLADNLNLGTSAVVRFINNATFTGANATFGANAGLYWQQVGTLSGKTLTQGSNSYLYVSGVNNAVTLDSATTVTGTANIYSDFSAGTAVTNQGTITHSIGTGQIYANTVINAGTITATGGTLYLGTTSAGFTFANNAGATINVNGANVFLQAPAATPIINFGAINVQSGTLFSGTVLNNGSTGTITGAGTINGSLTMAGGSIAPGNSGIGTLNFSNGILAVTSASTFNVELGGTLSDQILFQGPSGNIDIGAGLFNLNLNLLSVPTPGTTYTIMRIASGPNVFTGTFAGLPTSGSTITATFASVPYTFQVSYLTNAITLAVPEPSTYVLMTLGLALLSFRRRRVRL